MRSGFLSGPAEAPRVRKARQALEQAEVELRRRRQARLRAEGPSSTGVAATASPPAAGGDEGEVAAEAGGETVAEEVVGGLSDEALASLQELGGDGSPPALVHRLVELVVLLFKAPTLVSLGQAPLPRHVPWESLHLLLRRTAEARPAHGTVVAALRERPWGTRLRQHLRSYLDDGDVQVTREQARGCGEHFVEVFDFVTGTLDCSQEAAADAPLVQAGLACGPAEGESLALAVVEQEREVAALRRKLKEIQSSEAVAQAFVAKHSPGRTSATAVPAAAEVESTTASGSKGTGAAAAGEELAVADKDTTPCEVLDTAKALQAARQEQLCQGVLNQAEVISCQQLQYRLGETGVPPLHEAVLQSIENMLLEPRTEDVRRLDIVGFSEMREEPSVAQQRVDAVLQWFVSRDLPPEALSVEARPEGERGSRRVELRVLGEAGSGGAVRQRAEELLKRVGVGASGSSPPLAAAAAPAAPATPAATAVPEVVVQTSGGYPPSQLVAPSALESCRVGPRLLSLDERPAAAGRGLRVVFALEGLCPADVSVEYAEDAVRLVSTTTPWPEGDLDVRLPFAVAPPTAGARFSRRAGTLTVDLSAL